MAEPITYRTCIVVHDGYFGATPMRGAFNKTMSVRHGTRSLTGPPLVTYAVEIPCRFVPQLRITQQQFDFTFAGAWLTNDVLNLVGPFTSSPFLGAIFTDQLAADEVQIDSDPGVWYSVCRREDVDPYRGADYYRYLVIPLSSISYPGWPPPVSPPPPPVPPVPPTYVPGLECSEATALPFPMEGYLGMLDPDNQGYYSVELAGVGPWRVEVLNPDFYGWILYASVNRPIDDCCVTGTPITVLQWDAVHCGTFTALSGQTSARICLQVYFLEYGDPPAALLVRITSGSC